MIFCTSLFPFFLSFSRWSCLGLFIRGVNNRRSVPVLANWQLLTLHHLDRSAEPVWTCQSLFTRFPFLWISYLTRDSQRIYSFLLPAPFSLHSPHSAKAFLVSFCVSPLSLSLSFILFPAPTDCLAVSPCSSWARLTVPGPCPDRPTWCHLHSR